MITAGTHASPASLAGSRSGVGPDRAEYDVQNQNSRRRDTYAEVDSNSPSAKRTARQCCTGKRANQAPDRKDKKAKSFSPAAPQDARRHIALGSR